MNWFILLSKENPSSDNIALFSNASKIVKPLRNHGLRIINLFENQQIVEFPEGVLDFYLKLYYPAYGKLSPKMAQTVLGEITERLKNPSIFRSYILPLLPANTPNGNYIVAISPTGHFAKKLGVDTLDNGASPITNITDQGSKATYIQDNPDTIVNFTDTGGKTANENASLIAKIQRDIEDFLKEILGDTHQSIYPKHLYKRGPAWTPKRSGFLEDLQISESATQDSQTKEEKPPAIVHKHRGKPDSDSDSDSKFNSIAPNSLDSQNTTEGSLIKKIYHYITARDVDFQNGRDLQTVVDAYDITFPNEEVLHFLEQVQKHKLELGLVQLLDAVLSKVKDQQGLLISKIGEKNIFAQESPSLAIDTDYKIYLHPNGPLLKLDPLHNSFYLLFLSHPEGINLPSIGSYKKKLLDLYMCQSDRENLTKIEKSVARICNLRDNSIFEKISRINSIIKSTLSKIQVDPSAYYISGERGKAKSVKLPPEKLIWPNRALF